MRNRRPVLWEGVKNMLKNSSLINYIGYFLRKHWTMDLSALASFTGVLALLAVLGISASPSAGEEFRVVKPIATPKVSAPLPAGARRVKERKPIDLQKLADAIKDIMASWNTPKLASKLSDKFYDKDHLLDALNTRVTRDARLSILSIQGIQILDQYVIAGQSGALDTYVSTVSATVRTQVEFNDPVNGFQRLNGTNEYILKVTHQ